MISTDFLSSALSSDFSSPEGLGEPLGVGVWVGVRLAARGVDSDFSSAPVVSMGVSILGLGPVWEYGDFAPWE